MREGDVLVTLNVGWRDGDVDGPGTAMKSFSHFLGSEVDLVILGNARGMGPRGIRAMVAPQRFCCGGGGGRFGPKSVG